MTDRTYASVPSGRRPELGRHGVGAEVGRDDVDRALLAEPVGGLEQPDLRLEVEAVAGLRLDRRDAVAEHLVEPAPAVGHQLVGRWRRGWRRRSTGSRRRPRGSRGSPAPRWRSSHSPSREPANSRCVCGSTRPGRDRAAAGVEPGEPAERVALGFERGLERRPRPDRGDPALPAGDDRRVRGVRPADVRRRQPADVALAVAHPDAAGERSRPRPRRRSAARASARRSGRRG